MTFIIIKKLGDDDVLLINKNSEIDTHIKLKKERVM